MHNFLFIHNIIKYNNHKLKYILSNFIVIFIFSLIYWYFGTNEHLSFNNKDNNLKNISYISALYFSFTTNSTVSYGDIAPKSKFMQSLIMLHISLLIINISILIL